MKEDSPMSINPFSLEGKTVLVTGASSGIGRETAIRVSQMGGTVVVVGRNRGRLEDTFAALEGTDRVHRQVVCDQTNEEDLERLIDGIPQLDGVVQCAGTSVLFPFQFSTREKYDRVFEVNFFSTVELLRLLYKKKKISNGGSVVLIASVGGTTVFDTGNGVYGASKAALVSTMKFCAKEFAKKRIRVNAIAPGRVHTPLIESGTMTDEQIRMDEAKYPLGRYGEPADVAHGVIYLLSDAAAWGTGAMLVIDGGLSI